MTDEMTTPLGDASPVLLTVIHTEEEFDWSAPFDRDATAVTHLRHLGHAHDIFLRHGVDPTYMVDWCVASQDAGVNALRAVIAGSRSTVGAHLHPWVNPPFDEDVSVYNSFPGNLPRSLEKEKLRRLTDRIGTAFGTVPTVYLAGRYGFGTHTLSILQELGYRVDLSGVAMTDYSAEGGPDYSHWDNHHFWEGNPPVLRIPHNVADIGFLCRRARRLLPVDRWALLRRLRAPALLARCHAIERIRLSPEGFTLEHLKGCAHGLLTAGVRVMIFSFHSPSLAVGFTPYVRDAADLKEFLYRIDGFLRFFREEIGGHFGVPDDVLATGQAN